MDEEQLIDAVLRVRAATPDASTAAAVHAALVAEGLADLTLSQVKKASSKASKRQAPAPAPAPAAPSTAAAPPSKKAAKAAKAAESTFKAAETFMMEMNRNLRMALGDDEYSAAVATSDRGEKFISMVTQRALEAKLTPAESLVPRERAAADLATLEWMVLAETAGTLQVPEDAKASALAQIERLKTARASKSYTHDRAWVTECFVLPEADDVAAAPAATGPPSGIDYVQNSSVLSRETAGASLDRALAKSGMLGVGGCFDDDID